MPVNLLAKIEAEINQVVNQIWFTKLESEDRKELIEKRNKLHDLALEYLKLEGKFKEIAALNSVY